MTRKEIAKQTLDRRMEEYEKHKKFKNKKDLDKATETLIAQVRTVQRINLINTAMANEYLSRMEKKYMAILHEEQFREYREQVININDDFITGRERLLFMRKQEYENTSRSMENWKKAIDRKTSAAASDGAKERTEISKDKENEREKEAENAQ